MEQYDKMRAIIEKHDIVLWIDRMSDTIVDLPLLLRVINPATGSFVLLNRWNEDLDYVARKEPTSIHITEKTLKSVKIDDALLVWSARQDGEISDFALQGFKKRRLLTGASSYVFILPRGFEVVVEPCEMGYSVGLFEPREGGARRLIGLRSYVLEHSVMILPQAERGYYTLYRALCAGSLLGYNIQEKMRVGSTTLRADFFLAKKESQ